MSIGSGRRTASLSYAGIVAYALFLLIALLSVSLAHASPPDPSWIPGIYDDADLDDVVLAVTTASGVVDRAPQSAGEPVPAVATCLEIRATRAASSAVSQVAECRAPPA